jgi:hypothetical protein
MIQELQKEDGKSKYFKLFYDSDLGLDKFEKNLNIMKNDEDVE